MCAACVIANPLRGDYDPESGKSARVNIYIYKFGATTALHIENLILAT
jgi:hypothetical protein